MVNASTVASVTGITLLTGFVGYAVYFDYKRRNDPTFRSRLRKDAKRTRLETKKALQRREKEEEVFLQNIVKESSTAAAPDEQTFSQNVQIGELLAAQGPEHHLQAAAAFFKALKAYPSPMELLMIYQQAVPAEVMAHIRKMIALDPALSAASKGSARAADLVNQASANIEEIDDEGPKATSNNASATISHQEDSAPSVSSQEWEKVNPADAGEQRAQQTNEAFTVPTTQSASQSIPQPVTNATPSTEQVVNETQSAAPPS